MTDGIGKIAKIGGDRNLNPFGAKGKTHRIGRVVRDGETGNVDIADGETRTGLEQFEVRSPVAPIFVPCDGRRGHAGDINRDAKFAGDGLQAANMIGMLVRNQNRGERFRVLTRRGEPLERFLARKAGVDQETGSLRRNQRAIAGARRRENRYLDD
jgi:hypothetical protein